MQVERLDKEILIRIPNNKDSEKLEEMLDLLRYAELTSQSTASQEEVNEFASETNKSWWKENKDKYIK